MLLPNLLNPNILQNLARRYNIDCVVSLESDYLRSLIWITSNFHTKEVVFYVR